MKTTTKAIVLALVWVLPSSASNVTGQESRSALMLGAWFGGEAIPQALNPGCGNTTGTEGGWTFGGHLAVPVGSLFLEGRASWHSGVDYLCPGVLMDRTGVHTITIPDVPFGSFAKTDARLRVEFGPWLVLGLGAGWAWSKDVPYLASSVGVRGGDTVRFGADLEFTSYRIPFRSRTSEFDHVEEVRVLSRGSFTDWGGAVSLRLLLEVPAGAIY